MTSNRIKLAKAVVATRAEAESILGEISADQAKLNGLKAELDAAVTAIRQQYEGAIDEISTTIERKTGLLQQWAIDATDDLL